MEFMDYAGMALVLALVFLWTATIEAVWTNRGTIADEARGTLYELTHRR
jgi:hypothetical protein